MLSCRRRRARMRSADRSVIGAGFPGALLGAVTSSRAAKFLTLIAHENFVPQVVPDLTVDLAELRLHANLGHVARSRQRHRVVGLHRARPGADDKNAVRQGDRFLEVVRDENNRRAGVSPQRQELVFHQRSRLYIEGAEGLVHEQDLRLVDQALREGDALAHATGQLIGVPVLEPGEADARYPLARHRPGLAGRPAVVARSSRDVVEHRLPREDRIGLEDVPDVLRDAAHRLAEDQNLAFAGRLQARDQSQRGRLATTCRSDHGAELARLDRQVQVALIVLSALIGAAAAVWQAGQELDRQYEQRSLAIAESVATNLAIQDALLNHDPDGSIQRAAEDVRRSTGARYVVVTDAQGIRYSHPNPAMIGKPVDEDPSAVLAGHTWVGVQKGTLGVSARGKAPIFNQGHVIGLVSVGYLEDTVGQQLLADLPGFATTVLLSLGLGVAGSMLLASRLKRQTFGLEPYEIAGLLEEREASLQGIHEGAIATDGDGTITLANEPARPLLPLPTDCVRRKVAQVLPQGRLLKFLSGGLKDEDEVLLAGERVLVASRRAIVVRGQTIGHVATLRDTTELTGLARGLGVESLTDALRAQAHEFANRLHTIAGLMQVGRAEEAMKLIAQTSGLHQELTESLMERVGDPVLGALLLAKAAVASERGIELRVSDDTVMTRSKVDSEDLITLLGNLIDNALDAAASSNDRWVSVSVTEQRDELVFKVHDSGAGVPEGIDGQIFQEGFSTKNGQNRKRRGFGLALVRQVARRNGGDVSVVNEGGALFTVRLPTKVGAPT